jgi:hypothetical protein
MTAIVEEGFHQRRVVAIKVVDVVVVVVTAMRWLPLR